MKANVDQNTCIGCGLCVGTCPAVFHMNEEGKSSASEEEMLFNMERKCTNNSIHL